MSFFLTATVIPSQSPQTTQRILRMTTGPPLKKKNRLGTTLLAQICY